jgi:hypothetical protein
VGRDEATGSHRAFPGHVKSSSFECGYDARCNVRDCKAKATTLARSVDLGRPMKQYELCSVHADEVAQREKLRGGTP